MTKHGSSKETPNTIYAILDNNALLHFEFVNQINWPAVLGAKQVCLVLSPILFQELDDVKEGMTKPGRRALAQRVLKTLGELVEAVPLDHATPLPGRPNTTPLYASEDDLAIDESLREEKQDDHLIATTLHFIKQHPDDTVILVSDDITCRQRAKRFGITARTLPETLRRPLPRTEEEERLRRLEALEPQVQIDFGTQGELLLLPYTDLVRQLNALWVTYKERIKDVIQALEEDHANFTGDSAYYLGDANKQKPQKVFGDSDIDNYNVRDQRLIRALKEFDLRITDELLRPKPKVLDYYTKQPKADARPPFERWEKNVSKLYDLVKEREEPLFLARQALQYYAVLIVLTHTGGRGIEDGQITVTLEGPCVFKTAKPLPPEQERYVYQPYQTQWLPTPETPSSRSDTPQRKTFKFGNFHPGKILKCDPLYIFVESPAEVKKSGMESTLTVEVSGLNVHTPIRKVVTVKLV